MCERTYTTKEFAVLVGREVRTLYAWAREGKLKPKKDFNGRNIYTKSDFKKVMGYELEDKQSG